MLDIGIGAHAETCGGRLRDATRWLLEVSRLLPILLVLASLEVRAAEPSVGIITRVENEAEVVSAGGSTAALVGTVLHLKDELRTGADARLQVTFRDSTTLTLGEKAIVVIDRYVFDPDQGTGDAAIDATKGAIRFATGKLQGLSQKTITVSTPVAALGVRGTEFWSGQNSVLLLKPTVTVSNQGGSVTLKDPWHGTYIQSQSTAPTAPTLWSAAQIADALAMTDFQAPPGQRRDQNGPNQQKGGQNGTPGQSQQYALSAPSIAPPIILGFAPLAAFITSTQVNEDEDDPVSP